jgi:CO/xanthine dehydrogenase Mo-binding subunit
LRQCGQDRRRRASAFARWVDVVDAQQPFLASDRVRFVGHPVALVVAETYAQAKDAGELVVADYDPIDAVGTLEAAERGMGVPIWDAAPDHVALDWEAGDASSVDEAFAKAAFTASIDVVENRIVCNAMEPRTAIGNYDPESELLTLHSPTQGVAGFRALASDPPNDQIRLEVDMILVRLDHGVTTVTSPLASSTPAYGRPTARRRRSAAHSGTE